MSEVVIAPVDFADPRAARLRADMAAEIDDRYADYPPNYGGVAKARPEEFVGSRGLYVIADSGGDAVGVGGVRLTEPGTAEIKNVYVVPDRRGRRVAEAIMEALEGWAREAGCSRLVLETGERQPEALALYDRLGFVRIPAYPPWDDELSICLAKPLDRPDIADR